MLVESCFSFVSSNKDAVRFLMISYEGKTLSGCEYN